MNDVASLPIFTEQVAQDKPEPTLLLGTPGNPIPTVDTFVPEPIEPVAPVANPDTDGNTPTPDPTPTPTATPAEQVDGMAAELVPPTRSRQQADLAALKTDWEPKYNAAVDAHEAVGPAFGKDAKVRPAVPSKCRATGCRKSIPPFPAAPTCRPS